MAAYYNEMDAFAAAWLRELIKAGHIAPGDVDERSISDVQTDDLRGYTQCHFFAGIGVWSYALRCAGWTDDRPVWTGSCPCQPFSSSGKGEGFTDPRHLWPEWFRLIREYRPVAVFGEQVGAAIRHGWLDLVQADLESEGYAVGAAVMGAHSLGAPHIRQRLYFVADAEHAQRRPEHEGDGVTHGRHGLGRRGATSELGDTGSVRRGGRRFDNRIEQESGGVGQAERGILRDGAAAPSPASILEYAEQSGLEGHSGDERDGNEPGRLRADAARPTSKASLTNGFWRDAIWLPCRDGKARPTQPGLFPLAHGSPARVGRLRGYGNAIVAPQAEAFVRAYMQRLRGTTC